MAKKHWWKTNSELPKAHSLIPDLGMGEREERDPAGQLMIYLKRGFIPTPYIVLGKYARPKEDGTEYYVADWTQPGVNPKTTHHEHLVLAVAKVSEIIDANDKINLAYWAGRSATKKED